MYFLIAILNAGGSALNFWMFLLNYPDNKIWASSLAASLFLLFISIIFVILAIKE